MTGDFLSWAASAAPATRLLLLLLLCPACFLLAIAKAIGRNILSLGFSPTPNAFKKTCTQGCP